MNLEEWSIRFFFILVIPFIGLFLGMVYKGFDRKITAMMQARIGPPLRQPFRDVKKLFMKENIVPDHAVEWIFHAAPLVALVAPLATLVYLPLGPFEPVMKGYGDLILILYLLAIPAVAMAVGGLASGSPYATVGAQRELVLMMSYEFPLAIAVVTIAWKYESFSLATISATPVWSLVGAMGTLGLVLISLGLFAVLPGELSKVPFDQAEAETELAGGIFVEYSGRNLGIFYLAEAVKMIVVGTLLIALLFPQNLSHWYSFGGPEIAGLLVFDVIADILFFLLKLLIIIFIGVSVVRVAVARFQIDKASYFYWVPMTLLGLLGTILVVMEGAI
ncbi:MAG: complex I subunit 1 family protein [Thermoplasmata archaeon]